MLGNDAELPTTPMTDASYGIRLPSGAIISHDNDETSCNPTGYFLVLRTSVPMYLLEDLSPLLVHGRGGRYKLRVWQKRITREKGVGRYEASGAQVYTYGLGGRYGAVDNDPIYWYILAK